MVNRWSGGKGCGIYEEGERGETEKKGKDLTRARGISIRGENAQRKQGK